MIEGFEEDEGDGSNSIRNVGPGDAGAAVRAARRGLGRGVAAKRPGRLAGRAVPNENRFDLIQAKARMAWG